METDQVLEACRLCANFYVNTTDVDFVHLFKPQDSLESQITFIRNMLEYWQLQVLPDDGLPQRICANCFTKFCNINSLREECLDAQTRLLDAILSQNMTGQPLCINEETSGGLHSFFAEELLEMQNAHMEIDHNASIMQTSELEQMQLLNNLTDLLQTDASSQQEETQKQKEQAEPQNITENLNNTQTSLEAPTPITEHNNLDNFDLEDMLVSNVIHKRPNDSDNINNNNNNNNDDDNNGLGRIKNGYNDCNSSDYSDSMTEEGDDEEELVGRVMTNPLACQYCHCPAAGSMDHLIFKDCDALSQHFFDMHDPKRPYNCPQCPRNYQTMRKREEHVRTLHKEKAKGNDIHNDGNNNNKLSENTSQSNILQCMYCFEKVRGSMELHEFNCNFISDWKCSQCQEEFHKIPLHHFRTHERIHDPNKKLFCRLCDRAFSQPEGLATHEEIHFPQKYTCELCNEGYNSEYLLKRHKYSVHEGDMPVHCNICDKGFSSFAFFQRHQNQYHPENQQDSNCSDCGAKFSSSLQLRNHLAKPKDENGKCVDSTSSPPNKRARSKNAYITFSCKFCGKQFTTKELLEKHLTTHNQQERPLQCEKCQVRCRNDNELQEHITVAHLQELSFKCALCEQVFNCKQQLKDHLATHSGLGSVALSLNEEVNQQNIYNSEDVQSQAVNVNGESNNSENLMENSVNYLNLLNMPTLSENLTQLATATTDNEKNITVPMTGFQSYFETNIGTTNDDQYFLSSMIDAENEIII